jgi:acetoin utilization deacetylase AcuC-like enzyme
MGGSYMIVYSEKYLEHNDKYHPENNRRLKYIMNLLTRKDVFEKVPLVEPIPAKREDILRVHTPEHFEFIRDFSGDMIDADTYVTSKSYETAMLAAGGVITCVDHCRNYRYTFALVRPPGHHAESERAMGFCLFNNLAVGVRYAEARYKFKKIFILDFDLHHGNGTQEIIQSDSNVLFVSLHQYPFYPGTGGVGEIEKNIINIPLPPGTCDSSYLRAIERIVFPVMREFNPEITFVSAGYDGHYKDPLGGMNLTTTTYYEIARRIVQSKVRTVFVLEGGYSLDALAKSVYATMIPLYELGDEPLEEPLSEEKKVTEYIESRLKVIAEKVSEYWTI